MRSASQRFFIHSCIYLQIFIISILATFLGTNSLSVLMCRKAVNQSILGYCGAPDTRKVCNVPLFTYAASVPLECMFFMTGLVANSLTDQLINLIACVVLMIINWFSRLSTIITPFHGIYIVDTIQPHYNNSLCLML